MPAPKRLVMLILVGLLLAGCGDAPALTTTPSASSPAGYTLGLELSDQIDQMRLDLIDQSGAHWIRIPLRWTVLEPKRVDPPKYRWHKYDDAMSQLSGRGFRVILTLRDNPKWAADSACGPLNETGKVAFAEMLDALVRRYSAEPSGIRHWELYNEPDNRAEAFGSQGGCWGDAPAAYAEMLEIAYAAIKGADPDATVLFGGVALEKLEGDPFNVRFLEEVLEAGGGDYFDWMNFHYYPAFSYRWDKFGRGVEGKANYVRKVMRDAGVDKPLICSEIGQPSAGPADEGYSDERTMAQIYKGFARAIAANLETAIWHKLEDRPTDERLYGLLDEGLEPKPAYATYQALARQLSDAYFVGVMGDEETGSDIIEAYRFSLSGTDRHNTLLIVWRENEGPDVAMQIPAAQAVVIDTAGRETVIADGDAGDLNEKTGSLAIGISTEPVLIRY